MHKMQQFHYMIHCHRLYMYILNHAKYGNTKFGNDAELILLSITVYKVLCDTCIYSSDCCNTRKLINARIVYR